MSRTLYVTDLDGTLLGSDGRVSAASARMLRELSASGVAVTAATARTPATVQPLLEHCGLRIPAVVMTGAAFWDFGRQEYSEVHRIPADLAREIGASFAEVGMTPFVYTLHEGMPLHVYHAGRQLNKSERRFVDERSNLPLKRFYLNAEAPDSEAADHLLYFGMGDTAIISGVAEALRRRCPGLRFSWYSDTYTPGLSLIEVQAPGVDKAAAVLRLKERLGADRLVVYGDNLNDLPMMAVADLAVAVGNAVPRVKQAARTVIGLNTEDAVPRHISALDAAAT